MPLAAWVLAVIMSILIAGSMELSRRKGMEMCRTEQYLRTVNPIHMFDDEEVAQQCEAEVEGSFPLMEGD